MQKFREKVVLLDGAARTSIDGFRALDPTATFYVFPNVARVCNELGHEPRAGAFMLQGADDEFGIASLGGECFGKRARDFCASAARSRTIACSKRSSSFPKAIARRDRLAAWLTKNPQYRPAQPYTVEQTARNFRRAARLVMFKACDTVYRFVPLAAGYHVQQVIGLFLPGRFPSFCLPGFCLYASDGRRRRANCVARSNARASASTARSATAPADDLQTHGQPFGREPARHADRGRAGHADRVAARHPVDVGAHRHAVDRAHPLRLDGERQHLHRRQHEEIVRREEARDARIELGSAARPRARDRPASA